MLCESKRAIRKIDQALFRMPVCEADISGRGQSLDREKREGGRGGVIAGVRVGDMHRRD